MASTLRTGAPPRPLVIALEALQRIADLAGDGCLACRDIRAEVAAGHLPDQRVEREHRRKCPGEVAWPAIVAILRHNPGPPAPAEPS